MPKLKTRQCVAKRIKISRKNKLIKITCGRDHFNAREKGKVTRNKRRPSKIAKSRLTINIRKQLPYS